MGDVRFVDGFVSELECGISIFRTCEIIGYLDGIATVVTEQNQIVVGTAELHLFCLDIDKAESLFTLGIRYKIRTVSFSKHIGIVPGTAVELIVAYTADQGVVAFIAVYPIVATACMDQAA